jgi:hypothetical protein
MAVTGQDKSGFEPGTAVRTLSDMLLRRYLVRELLWCGQCDQPWMPILIPPMARYYVCQRKACLHPAVPAKLMDHRVWTRLVRSLGGKAHQVPRECRHELLREVLTRVIVGQGMVELRLEWRECS